MDRERVEAGLLTFVSTELLNGNADDLTTATPLFDLGLLDSFSVLRLLAYVEREFDTAIPIEAVSVDDMRDVSSLAALVVRQS
jgi:acyl carrier protein